MVYQYLIFAGLALGSVWLLFYLLPFNIWITAVFSGVQINLLDLAFMRFRKVPPNLIARSLILGRKAGITDINSTLLETHYLARGNVLNVIKAMIVADKANLELSFANACAIDLAGRNVLEAVQISVTPYIINVPSVMGVSNDGIQLIADVRVTVRTNIKQLVGGAGEETIKARVGQGIISSIGAASSYLRVLEEPGKISKLVLSHGLDAGTAFEILSIDIADINIGKNIGAKLQIDQAMADLEIAKARAEKRRAQAVAFEQEMMARIEESKAKVIQSEAEIPSALSEAFLNGSVYTKVKAKK